MVKSPSQLKQEIEAIVSRGDVHPGVADRPVVFYELILDSDPNGMQVAEDFLLEKGWKLREVGGGLSARNFTFAMNPMSGPRDRWKMVQTSVADKGSRSEFGLNLEPGRVWIKVSAANGPDRVGREREMTSPLDDAKRIAVANAWAMAKEIKKLPLDAGRAALERIVDRHFNKKTSNLRPRELF